MIQERTIKVNDMLFKKSLTTIFVICICVCALCFTACGAQNPQPESDQPQSGGTAGQNTGDQSQSGGTTGQNAGDQSQNGDAAGQNTGDQSQSGDSTGQTTDGGVTTIHTPVSVTWAALPGGDNELSVINNSKLIALGVAKGNHVENVESDAGGKLTPFTHFDFQIEQIYAADKGWVAEIRNEITDDNRVDIRMTGDDTYVIGDAPLLELGKTYLVFLDKAKEYAYFLPVGGRLGMAEVTDANTLHFTSSQAAGINTDFEGKGVDTILESLSNQKLDSSIVINIGQKPVDEFLTGAV